MTFHRALSGLLVTAVFGACAVQVDEPTRSDEPTEPEAGRGGSAGVSGSGSVSGKGGSTSVPGGGSGGATTSSGKGGSAGSTAGKGGATTAGATNGGAGSGGGGSNGGGSSGSAGGPSGGSVGSTSCDGLPEWTPGAQPPDAPMTSGEELTFNTKKWLYAGSGDLWNFDGGCPPETTNAVVREAWCDGSAQNQYTLVGPCE